MAELLRAQPQSGMFDFDLLERLMAPSCGAPPKPSGAPLPAAPEAQRGCAAGLGAGRGGQGGWFDFEGLEPSAAGGAGAAPAPGEARAPGAAAEPPEEGGCGGGLQAVAEAAAPVGVQEGQLPSGGDSTATALFWGICDLKYDPAAPPQDRVRVLELGDGCNSCFSHHGVAIRETFHAHYRLSAHPLRCSVLVENKKVTHDRFVHEGFKHLRPRTGCYPRHYTPELAGRILQEFPTSNLLVLKLCNRARGAGVLVVPCTRLDAVLQRLLVPPDPGALEAMLQRQRLGGIGRQAHSVLREQSLHWWSNECPVFLVEECCRSTLVPLPGAAAGDALFDATMRVGFALCKGRAGELPEDVARPSGGGAGGLQVRFLGAYWKLPQRAAGDNGVGGESLEDLRDRVVSSFGGVEKRTAEVSPEHCADVFDALRAALPAVFRRGALEVRNLGEAYGGDPLLHAFLLARTSANVRITHMEDARALLERARALLDLQNAGGAGDLPRRGVLSYISRNLGVCDVMCGALADADRPLRAAVNPLDGLPTNATAFYTWGCLHEKRGDLEEGAHCMLTSVILDPDFKLSYVSLAACYAQLGQFEEAAEASRCCIRRFYDTPAAHYNLGQALYQLARGGRAAVADRADLCKQAVLSLSTAKAASPESWVPGDERMLRHLRDAVERGQALPKLPVRTWRLGGWRP